MRQCYHTRIVPGTPRLCAAVSVHMHFSATCVRVHRTSNFAAVQRYTHCIVHEREHPCASDDAYTHNARAHDTRAVHSVQYYMSDC